MGLQFTIVCRYLIMVLTLLTLSAVFKPFCRQTSWSQELEHYNYFDDVITGFAPEGKGRLEQIDFGRKEKTVPSEFLSDVNRSGNADRRVESHLWLGYGLGFGSHNVLCRSPQIL